VGVVVVVVAVAAAAEVRDEIYEKRYIGAKECIHQTEKETRFRKADVERNQQNNTIRGHVLGFQAQQAGKKRSKTRASTA
jgi:hypothetical protein